MKKIFAGYCLLLLLPFNSLFANNYYLSNNGNDSNSGNSAVDPWQSINQLNTVALLPGDSILFLSGNIFKGQVNVYTGGTETAPVYLGTYGGINPAVISGSEWVTTWSVFSGNIYQAFFPQVPAHLFSNDKQMTLARYPNSGFLIHQDGIGSSGFMDTALLQPNGYWNGATVRMRVSDRLYEKNRVDSFSNFTIMLQTNSALEIERDFGYYFDNMFTELDTANEWYYNESSQLFYFYSTEDPNLSVMEASVYDAGISIQGGSNFITIANLQFEKQRQDGIIFTGYTSGILIENCRFSLQGEHGIDMPAGAAHSIIAGNQFEDINCIGIGARYLVASTISGNTLKKIGLIPGYGLCTANSGFGIDLELSDSLVVSHNLVDSTGSGAIFAGLSHSLIEKNLLYHNLLTLNNLGGIYSYGPQGNYNMIRDNFIMHTTGNNASSPTHPIDIAGIYFEESYYDSVIHNTVAFSRAHGILVTTGSSSNEFSGNLIYGCEQSQVQFIEGTTTKTENNTVTGNTFYSIREAVDPVQLITDTIKFIPATFDSNYYFNPYDYFAFHTRVLNAGNAYNYFYTLLQWQNYSGNDIHSKNTFFYKNRYQVVDTLSDNLVTNGNFSNNLDGWNNDYASNITMLLDNSTPLDGGCMKLVKSYLTPEPNGSVFNTTNGVDSGSFLLLHINTYSTNLGNIGFLITKNGGGYDLLADSRYFPCSPDPANYNTVVQTSSAFDGFRINMLITYVDSISWLDNIGVYPVSVSYQEPMKISRLFTNATDQLLSFNLGDSIFYDLDQHIVTQQLSLEPYSSVVLIFDSSMILGTHDIANNSESLKLYPNPAKTGTTIHILLNKGIKEMIQIEWFDVSGSLLKEEKIVNYGQSIFLMVPEKLQEGMYFLKIKSSNQIYTAKLVVAR